MPKHGSNIRKRKDGRWEGRYKDLQGENPGKYKSVYGKTCREVTEKLEIITAQKNQPLLEKKMIGPPEKPGQNFGGMAGRWLDNIRETRKYSTYVKYRNVYERHIKNTIGSAGILDISYNLIKEEIFLKDSETKYSQNLMNSIIAIINQILKYASENDNYPSVQLTNKFAKTKGKKVEIISHKEQVSLIRYLYKETDASKAGILLCISTGLRLGEICSLKWEDVDFEQRIIRVCRTVQRVATDGNGSRTVLMVTEPKSVFSVREIPISAGIVQLLNKIRHDEEYIVGGSKPLEPRTYQNRFKRYLKETDVKNYNFHALRHTFATNCIDNDMDVKSLSEILGHASVQITLNRYVHPTMDTKRRQLAVLDSVYGQFCGNEE